MRNGTVASDLAGWRLTPDLFEDEERSMAVACSAVYR
jgi:hypothetical protein